MASQDDIATVITETLDNWFDGSERNPEAINHGSCDPFAQEVCSKLDGLELRTTKDIPEECVMSGKDGFLPEPWHVWVTDGEKHYDAEVPNGVEKWEDLPFFKRTLGF